MKVYKCLQGHISSCLDCPYCRKIEMQNELHEALLDSITEEGN